MLGRSREHHTTPIVLGALVPDAPMFVFYIVEKLRHTPERVIWSTSYFEPHWQDFFDVPNSLPLIAVGLAVALWRKRRGAVLFFASMGLHVLADLPLHHADAHRHLLPLSSWRFESPVSYWNPAYYGMIAAPLEALLALTCCALLARRHPSRRARIAIAGLSAVYLATIGFVVWAWA